MESTKERSRLPLKRNHGMLYLASAAVALLTAVTSASGLLYCDVLYPADDLLQTFLPTDGILLAIGLPMLLGSMWLARRGRLVGLLLWPGALFFTLYNHLVYVLALPLNTGFLLHLAVAALCIYTLIGLVISIDGRAVASRLSGLVPDRLSGGILAGLGLAFFLRALGVLVGSLNGQPPIAETDLALNSVDFLIAPTWVICGALLWRRAPLGYVAGLGLLLQASMLFVGLIIIMLLQPFISEVSYRLVDILIVFTLGLLCFVPFGLFVRGVLSERA